MTADILSFRCPLTEARAIAIVRQAVEDSRIDWSDHVMDKMVEIDVVTRQVMTVLDEGSVISGPRWDDVHEDWVIVLRKSVSGRLVCVAVGISESEGVELVTVY